MTGGPHTGLGTWHTPCCVRGATGEGNRTTDLAGTAQELRKMIATSHALSMGSPAASNLFDRSICDSEDRTAIFESARRSVIAIIDARRSAKSAQRTSALQAPAPAPKAVACAAPQSWSPDFDDAAARSTRRANHSHLIELTSVVRAEKAAESRTNDDPWSLWKKESRDSDASTGEWPVAETEHHVAQTQETNLQATTTEPTPASEHTTIARPAHRPRPAVSREEVERRVADLPAEIAKRVHLARRLDPQAGIATLIAAAQAERAAATPKRSWWSRA